MHNIPDWALGTNAPALVLALLVPFLLNWKPSPLAFLLTVILNVPTLIVFGLFVLPPNKNVSDTQLLGTLIVMGWGTAGVGLGLILWLILRITTGFDFHVFLDNQISRILDWFQRPR